MEATTSFKRKYKGEPYMELIPPLSYVGSGTSSKQKDSHSCATRPSIIMFYGKINCDSTDDIFRKIFFSNGVPFHVSNSPYYKDMVHAIQTS